ncbi:MAG: transcriptional regulator [Methanobacteriota archaeon]
MERNELLKNIRELLANAGFYVSDLCSIRLPGFDLVARRDNTLLIIKVLTNIDSFSENIAKELQTLASLLKASPLLIGEKTGFADLDNGVVYDRFGVRAITYSTLRDHLLDGIPIIAYAAPGGLYVNLDERKVQILRQDRGISLGEFARYVHVSRKTAQLYEKGMNARIDIASRIEALLDDTVAIPIDIFSSKPRKPEDRFSYNAERDRLQNFQREIFSLIEQLGYKVIPLDRCPFEAVSKEKDRILLTCVHKYDKKLVQKAQIISSISKITEKYAAVFIDKETEKTSVEGTALIKKKELKKFSEPEQIFELIIERIRNSEE